MMLYLIRHGQSSDGAKGLSQRVDAPLSIESRKHLSTLRDYLKSIEFDKVYSSPQPRATQTAETLFGENFKFLESVHEHIRPKHLIGKKRELAMKFWDEEAVEDRYDPQWKYEDSESFKEVINRVNGFIKYLEKENDEKIAVVTHGWFIRHFIGTLMMGSKYTPEVFFDLLRKISIENGGFVICELDFKTSSHKILEISNQYSH